MAHFENGERVGKIHNQSGGSGSRSQRRMGLKSVRRIKVQQATAAAVRASQR